MGGRKGGKRRKTRYLTKKNYKRRGKISITKYLQEFEEGDKVILNAEPAVQKGGYFKRFHGLTGEVVGKSGSCYEVMVKDSDKEKKLIIHPVHLSKED